jgi:hypothetical protein
MTHHCYHASVSKIPTSVQKRVLESRDLEPRRRTINSVDYYHCVYELLYRDIESSIGSVPTLSPSQGATLMKRQLLLSVALSVLATSAFALPAAEQATPQAKPDAAHISQTVAEGGRDRLEQKGLVEGGDRLQERNAVAEGGRDRLEQKGLVEGGSERLQKREFVAEGGRDRLEQKGLVEGGSDRLLDSANSLPRAAPTVWKKCIKHRAEPVVAQKKARSPVIGLLTLWNLSRHCPVSSSTPIKRFC